MQSFALADPARPGHRKLLALFLVDPGLARPRPSTRDVAPQQRGALRALLRGVAGLRRLPTEVLDMIVAYADGAMAREEAEAHRLRLMDERGAMAKENTARMFAAPFNMCEH